MNEMVVLVEIQGHSLPRWAPSMARNIPQHFVRVCSGSVHTTTTPVLLG